MEVEEEPSNLGLSLRLGSTEFVPERCKARKLPVQFNQLFPPSAREEVGVELSSKSNRDVKCMYYNHNSDQSCNSDGNNNNNDENGTRKKLRLTKDQSTLLEDSFKEHSTLNSIQKNDLAKRLHLKPRQVEVWFQNRRARTKVKQTELDYEFLKKCCESLRDENRRLKRELQEMRATKAGSSHFYVRYAKAASLTMCSSCNKIEKISEETKTKVIDGGGKPNKLFGGFDESALTC